MSEIVNEAVELRKLRDRKLYGPPTDLEISSVIDECTICAKNGESKLKTRLRDPLIWALRLRGLKVRKHWFDSGPSGEWAERFGRACTIRW
jgi:hypothetical protein